VGSIDICAVSKRFGHAEVIRGVDLSIRDGEFVVLVGPSGCGKSTLLRMIAGLEDISEGTISIDGQPVNGLPPQRRDVAMVFQSYALYPHYTVFENMAFGLKLKRYPRREIEERVRRAADILGLSELLQRYPKSLSGGQRQRVAMGRAIVRDPRLYLFDEPLSNLDAKLRISMRTEIKALHQSLKRTTVYVTHDQVEAMTMADRIVILRDGVIEQIGTPGELYRAPANQFVAGFIGAPTMNFIEGSVENEGDDSLFRMGDSVLIRLPCPVTAGQRVVLGVRPEDWSISSNHVSGSKQVLRGEIRLVEPTGPSDFLTVHTPAGALTVVAESGMASQGSSISLGVRPDKIHVFDRDSGARLTP
jgi:multiple sugar transport system ATP-binding protein